MSGVVPATPPPRPGRLAVECVAWRPLERNTLRGFADLQIPALRLTIRDCPVHRQGERRWVSLPAKPHLDRSRELVRDDGKIRYVPVLEWDNRDVGDAFSRAALEAIERAGGHP